MFWIIVYILAVPSFSSSKAFHTICGRDRDQETWSSSGAPGSSCWPGGIDLLLKTVRGFSNGYIGTACSRCLPKLRNLNVYSADPWEEFSITQGQTYNLRFFWQDLVRRVNEPGRLPYADCLSDRHNGA